MALTGQNFTMYRGETKQINFAITDSSDNPSDLTSGSLSWVMARNSTGGVLIEKTIGSGITVVSATGGLFRVNLASGDTISYQGDFYHRADFVNSASDRIILSVGYVTIYSDPTE